jgi:hypothetical protein
MFGESPSGFLRNNKSKQFVLCDQSPMDFKTRYYP